ncbi:response regulator [Gaoshiqia sediminis]|uniref:Response regulator n=1 Tax=Gaoshiqia sediminis TaxID=2986998 RepID=A0AA41Y930_9BACT|nr:response regulator [Gaoshiqia sediminis]MCW0481628.1 response regulator [Gaoshiqia sediminis]
MSNNKNPLIFVVEDNHVYNKLIVSFLNTNKFTNVESFTTGEEAVQAMVRQPAVVIQDYLLDGMNGIEVLKKSKKIAPNAEFIFLSGQDNIDVAINTIKYGAYDYIVKDQMALKKMVNKIEKIQSYTKLEVAKKRYKTGVILFFVVLALFIIVLITIAIMYPQYFGFRIGDI